MTLKLKDKVAIVTGASKGIGAGIARAYGLAGARIIVNYAKDETGAAKVVDDIVALGGKAIAVQQMYQNPQMWSGYFIPQCKRSERLMSWSTTLVSMIW